MNLWPQWEPPRGHGYDDTKQSRGEGDGSEHEPPREAAEVTAALSGRTNQDVHRSEQQTQEVERQREQRREDRQIVWFY